MTRVYRLRRLWKNRSNSLPAAPSAERALTAAGYRAHLSLMPSYCSNGLVAVLAAAVLLAGCQSSPTGPPAKRAGTSFKYGLGDGQTMATAVEVRTRSETEGGRLVLDWIRANYPGHTVQQQELIEQRGRAYNMVTIIGPGNIAQRVYFDISSYYVRFGSDGFPKPLS